MEAVLRQCSAQAHCHWLCAAGHRGQPLVFARARCGVGSCVCDLGYPCSGSPGALGVPASTRSGPARAPSARLPSLLLLPVQSASRQPQATVFSLMIKWDDGALAGALVRGGYNH